MRRKKIKWPPEALRHARREIAQLTSPKLPGLCPSDENNPNKIRWFWKPKSTLQNYLSRTLHIRRPQELLAAILFAPDPPVVVKKVEATRKVQVVNSTCLPPLPQKVPVLKLRPYVESTARKGRCSCAQCTN